MSNSARHIIFSMAVVLLLFIAPSCVLFEPQVARRLYPIWQEENEEVLVRFRELGLEKKWRLLVVGWTSRQEMIAVLDFGHSKWEAIYSTRGRILTAGLLPDGRIAILESREQGDGGNEEAAERLLVIADGDSGDHVGMFPIKDLPARPSRGPIYLLDAPPQPLLCGEDYVVFGAGPNILRYDLIRHGHELVHKAPDSWCLKKARECGKHLYLLVGSTGRGKTPGSGSPPSVKSRLLVLQGHRPFQTVAALDGVSDLLVVGERVVVVKYGHILEYHAAENRTTQLAEGYLLGAADDEMFAYIEATPNAAPWTLKTYSFSEGRSREIAPSLDVGLGRPYGFVSPDGGYVFLKKERRRFKPAYWTYEYRVYSLTSGEEVGAIYCPYLNEFHYFQVLGWLR